MVFNWQIIATSRYLNQIYELPISQQSLIEKKWIEVASSENPLDIGSTSTCGEQIDPSVVVIFSGLAYEFIYEINTSHKIIRLINCEKLTFLDYGQPE